MARRVLSLVIFRVVLICIALLYQILAILMGFKMMPFFPFLVLVIVVSVVSWTYLWHLGRVGNDESRLRRLVGTQFIADSIFISFVVSWTGGINSAFTFGYLVVILLSAVFLKRVGIYIITVICYVTFYLTVTGFRIYTTLLGGRPQVDTDELIYGIAGQFVIFFLIALVAAFLQGNYHVNVATLKAREKSIVVLKKMRNRIVDNMHSGLLLSDENGLVTYINRKGVELLRQEMDALRGLSVWRLFGVEAPSKDLSRADLPLRAEKWVDVNQLKRIFGISYSPTELDRETRGYLVIFQDLTEIKMLESHRHFNDKMAAIGKVSAGVAHEIRNPLASISGSIQVLKEFVSDEPETEELLDIVEKESTRLNTIVSTFLDYARPSAPTEMAKMDLVKCFERFLLIACNDADITGIQLKLRSPGLKALILGDDAKVTQIFWNLIRNASQASQPGGLVEVSFAIESTEVMMQISDSGVGMSREQLEDLFTPFQSFRGGGTGLGMSVVYEIVQLHHGNITVDSTPGEGTQVTLRFPKYEVA